MPKLKPPSQIPMSLNGLSLSIELFCPKTCIIIHIQIFFQPAISIGNVGQLAIDLLIYNLDLKRVGYLYDSSIIPLVGNDPFTSPRMQEGSLATSAEGVVNIYECV